MRHDQVQQRLRGEILSVFAEPGRLHDFGRTTENELAEVFRALDLSIRFLVLSFEAGRLSRRTYLSMLASSRSLFSELRQSLKGQELSGTEATALNELHKTLFDAGSR